VEQAVTPETPDNFGRVTTSTEPLPVQPPGVERVNWWWVTGVGTCLVSAVVDVATVDHGEPVVVWGRVPRWWYLVGTLLGLGLVSLIASWARRLGPSWDDQVRPSRGWPRRIATGALATGSVLVATALFLSTAVTDSFTTYTVLSPPSPGGCRVLIGEHSFLLLGSGRIYLLPAGDHRPREVDSYLADDGYRPIANRTYQVNWQGELLEMTLWGTPFQPVTYTTKPLSCA